MRRRSLAARAWAVAAAAAALAACNAITGLSDDYHLATTDGGAPGNDGAGNDGEPPGDGGHDGEADADASRDGFCATADAANGACFDFDDPGADAGGTTYEKNASAASVRVVAGEGKAGSGGLVVHHERLASAPSSYVWFAVSLPQTAFPREFAAYEMEYDVRTTETALDYVALGILTFPSDWDSNAEYGTALYGNQSKNIISKLAPQGDGKISGGDWHHVRVRLTRGDGSFARDLLLDGTQIDTSAYLPPASGTSEVRLGAFNSSLGAGSVTTTFDDLVVRRFK